MNNQKQKMELLGNAPIPKALLAMGIPTMIGMLINALYNLVDAYFVGGLGESQMGAISIVSEYCQHHIPPVEYRTHYSHRKSPDYTW